MKRRKRTPQQERRALWERDYDAAKLIVKARSGGRCEYVDDGVRCISPAAPGAHHKLQSRNHPKCNDPENLVDLCRHHHIDVIHMYPDNAYKLGWLLHDWDVPRDAA